MFLLEGIEDDSPDTTDGDNGDDHEDLEISIHAITGTQRAQTMQIMGFISQSPLRILIDSGSTHCFLDATMARILNLPFQQKSTLKVAIANVDN